MEKKRIHTIQRPDKTWLAYKSETRHNYSASDEISAVVGLAKKLKLKLWNQWTQQTNDTQRRRVRKPQPKDKTKSHTDMSALNALRQAAQKVVDERYKPGGEWNDLSDAIFDLAAVLDQRLIHSKRKEDQRSDKTMNEQSKAKSDDMIQALQAGLEYTQELLIKHDIELGRTTRSNKWVAEQMEKDIQKIKECLKKSKELR